MTGEETLPIVNTKLDFVTGWLSRALVMLPIVSLALSAIFWLRYGIDMPYWDDWRKYTQGYMGSFDLGYLFTPENDTLYPVGKLLDSLAFRVLGGNSIPYQFLSMLVVLGGLLLLQWRLLVRCADSFLVAACAFSLTIFMLQPDSYWGQVDMAYHQAIPLLCILGALNLVFVARWQNIRHTFLIFVLGVLSGFTYISGAFATLTLGIALLVIRPFIEDALRHRLLAAGIALLGAGLFSVTFQMIGIAELEQSGRYNYPIAYPWMSDFWLYMLGKIARSLLLPVEFPVSSLITISMIIALVLVLAFVLIIQTVKRRMSSSALPSAVIFLSLLAVIFVYLGMISAGRAITMRPAQLADAIGVFSWGYFRFHFFWVTLLWPWLALILLNGLFRILRPGKTAEVIVLGGFALLMVLSVKYSQVAAHEPYYQQVVTPRLEGLECLRANFQSEGDFFCPQVQGLAPISSVLAIENARKAGASFVRDINYVPIALGTTAPALLYRLSERSRAQGHRWSNAQPAAGGVEGALDAADDPALLIDLEKEDELLNCRTLEVNTRFSATQADIAQLFYLLPGKTGFSEADSQSILLVNVSEPQTVSFRVSSDSGFLDKLRFDPVTGKQSLLIDDLEVRCRAHITQPFAGKVGANG